MTIEDHAAAIVEELSRVLRLALHSVNPGDGRSISDIHAVAVFVDAVAARAKVQGFASPAGEFKTAEDYVKWALDLHAGEPAKAEE